jgi:hypothetical protein
VVYKVSAGDVDGPAGEPFAITATHPLTPLVTPQPTTALTVGAQGPVRAGQSVRIEADIANPSPDLTAENTQVTLSMPSGVELVTGQSTQSLGTLNARGQPGDHAVAVWTVRGNGDGLQQLIATTSAARYGSTFRTSAVGSFSVDAQPPRLTLAAPAGSTTPDISLAWNGTDDGSGIASFDVDVATDDQSFIPWLSATTLTSSTYHGTPGSRYRFRIRATDAFGNRSGYVFTPEIAIPSGGGDTGGGPDPGAPPPSRPGLLSPRLTVTSVRRSARRLTVRGTVARGAAGKVTATWTPRRRARGQRSSRPTRASTYVHLRAFTLKLTISRAQRLATRGILVVRYRGGGGFSPQTRRITVASHGP